MDWLWKHSDNRRLSGARIANITMKKMKKTSVIAETDRTIGTALTEKGGTRMTDDERVLLIGIFMAVFLTFAIAVVFY